MKHMDIFSSLSCLILFLDNKLFCFETYQMFISRFHFDQQKPLEPSDLGYLCIQS